jgi:uncharacterized membrane protein YraQ (UPF0718 family)
MFKQFADLLAWRLLQLVPGTRLGEAAHFFFYDTLKIFVMLSLIIFLVAIIRSFFPPEKTRRILSYRHQYFGNIVAALLGVVTPF